MTDDLRVEWERWADGRIWQLKRKRHFADVDPRAVKKGAMKAARAMGKKVRTTDDKAGRKKYIWVQFADHEVQLGEPCPCGSRRLLRTHKYYAHCRDCKAVLLLSRSSVAAVEPEAEQAEQEHDDEAGALLDNMTDVHLEHVGRSGKHEVYRGYGQHDGLLMLLTVEFSVPDGAELTADDAPDHAVATHAVPIHDGDGARIMRSAQRWDLVF